MAEHTKKIPRADIYCGDSRFQILSLDDASVDCCVTSPPYYRLRDYGATRQIGLEGTCKEYIDALVAVFRQVHRVLKNDGTLWINIGDCYVSSKQTGDQGLNGERSSRRYTAASLPKRRDSDLEDKNLLGVPWRLAFALQDAGWILRNEIIWSKPNACPESVKDRCVRTHETIFLFAKTKNYYFDQAAIRQPASRMSFSDDGLRAPIDVWPICTEPCEYEHFAAFPKELARRCISAGSPIGGTVLDPFAGTGTTAFVARELGRNTVAIDVNLDYAKLIIKRLHLQDQQMELAI